MKKHLQKGFTLIEIAVTVFVIGSLVFLFTAAINMQHLIRDLRYRDIALKIAAHKMEEYRSLGYGSLPAGGGFTDSLLSLLPSGSASSSITTYNDDTKKIVVSVGWTGPRGVATVQSITTLMTEVGGL